MRSVEVIAGIHVRTLAPEDRGRYFKTAYRRVDLTPYREVVRAMEGGTAYAIGLNGTGARSTKIRLTKAAKSVGLKLRFAKVAPDAGELIVELSDKS